MFNDLEYILVLPIALILALLQVPFNAIGLGAYFDQLLQWITMIFPV